RGLLAGLADEGWDLAGADLIGGTSAGAVGGAQVTSGASLAGLHEAQLAPPRAEPVPRTGVRLAARWWLAAASSKDPVKVRARLGRMALAAKTNPQAQRLGDGAGRRAPPRRPGR